MSVEISFEELQAELDRLEAPAIIPARMTDVQYEAVKYARERGVRWIKLCRWFNGRFGTQYEPHAFSCKWHRERVLRGDG